MQMGVTTDTSYCPRCRKRTRAGSRFCTRCGLGLPAISAAPMPPPMIPREAAAPVRPTLPARQAIREYAAPKPPARMKFRTPTAPPRKPVVKVRSGASVAFRFFIGLMIFGGIMRACASDHESHQIQLQQNMQDFYQRSDAPPVYRPPYDDRPRERDRWP